jgi:hypothetical protein
VDIWTGSPLTQWSSNSAGGECNGGNGGFHYEEAGILKQQCFCVKMIDYWLLGSKK